MLYLPPPTAGLALVEEMPYAHPSACVILNVSPAIVIVPFLCTPVFAETVYPTVPLPVPDVPADNLIHEALLTAVQAHAAELTLTVPLIPPDDMLAPVDDSVYPQALLQAV